SGPATRTARSVRAAKGASRVSLRDRQPWSVSGQVPASEFYSPARESDSPLPAKLSHPVSQPLAKYQHGGLRASLHSHSLLSDDSNPPFANARVRASAIRNCHNHHDFVRTWRIVAQNRHRSEMIKRPNIVLVGQLVETRVAGWGGRTRTSEWRNQNPPTSPKLSMSILKKQRNWTDRSVNGLVGHSEWMHRS